MPSVSKSQQRLFSMALAVRKGKLKRSEVNQKVLDVLHRQAALPLSISAMTREPFVSLPTLARFSFLLPISSIPMQSANVLPRSLQPQKTKSSALRVSSTTQNSFPRRPKRSLTPKRKSLLNSRSLQKN